MQECIFTNSNVHKDGIERRHEFSDFSDINIANHKIIRSPLVLYLNEPSILHQCYFSTGGSSIDNKFFIFHYQSGLDGGVDCQSKLRLQVLQNLN